MCRLTFRESKSIEYSRLANVHGLEAGVVLSMGPVIKAVFRHLPATSGSRKSGRTADGRSINALKNFRGAFLFAGVVIGLLSAAHAVDPAQPGPPSSSMELPDAPGQIQSAEQPSPQPGTGSITGTVLDTTGAVVPGARVLLSVAPDKEERVMQSGPDGEFTFSGLPPGRYRVTVTSVGLGAFVSSEISMLAGESRIVPRIILPVAPSNVDVRVVVSDEQIATEQVKLAEKQRVLGVLPNFYSTYIWNAPPLTPKLKFDLAVHSAIDPFTIAASAALAGAEQLNNSFPGFGQGADGYFKRFGAAYGDEVISRMLGSAVLPSLLHQDPRYFYRGSGSIRSRAFYAIAAAVMCKGDDGHWQPNYSYIGGSFAAGAISTLYYPDADGGTHLILRNGFLDIAAHAGNNLFREFVFRKLTSNVPDYANGLSKVPESPSHGHSTKSGQPLPLIVK